MHFLKDWFGLIYLIAYQFLMGYLKQKFDLYENVWL